jgi:Glycerophosphoryl diester phosphodiesterase family
MFRYTSCVVWICVVAVACAQSQESPGETRVHANAHAHNDYYHARPLLDALDQGFGSVEADVFLVDGELLVAHSSLEVRRDRTLEKLYLEPLAKRCKANAGRVYRDGPELTLLVDLKTEAEATYAKLLEKLIPFEALLTKLVDGKVTSSAVRIVVSGNRPVETMAKQASRLAFLDGRMNDLDANSPVDLAPLISDQWSNHFKWRGRDAMLQDEVDKLNALVAKAHAQKRKLRFWGAPDNEATWNQLATAGVDLINTDKLSELANFLSAQ